MREDLAGERCPSYRSRTVKSSGLSLVQPTTFKHLFACMCLYQGVSGAARHTSMLAPSETLCCPAEEPADAEPTEQQSRHSHTTIHRCRAPLPTQLHVEYLSSSADLQACPPFKPQAACNSVQSLPIGAAGPASDLSSCPCVWHEVCPLHQVSVARFTHYQRLSCPAADTLVSCSVAA